MPSQQTLFKNYRKPSQWLYFEGKIRNKGFSYPAGVDEVGRGCLAGPVVAAAVILPDDCKIPGIHDSKQLSPQARETLYPIIIREALAFGLGMVLPEEIDRINILKASLLAMRKAIERLQPQADYLLVDGRDRVPGLTIEQLPLIAGDARSISIAAASIIAKVTRDRMMRGYARRYPDYFFERNKGYGTLEHRQALQAIGPSPIHRKSFAGVVL